MKNISNEVLKKIKDNNIKPKPRWYFITKNYFIWLIFGISIILGSFAFSMVLFIIKQLDWDIYHYIGESFLKTVFVSLPYLWLISVSYTHLRAHETRHDLVCRLLLEKKKKNTN